MGIINGYTRSLDDSAFEYVCVLERCPIKSGISGKTRRTSDSQKEWKKERDKKEVDTKTQIGARLVAHKPSQSHFARPPGLSNPGWG